MDPLPLVVTRGANSQLNSRTTDRHFERQEEASLQIVAIPGDRVDFAELVTLMDKSVATTSAPACADDNNVPVFRGPFALDSE
jgi:hypothetical protein